MENLLFVNKHLPQLELHSSLAMMIILSGCLKQNLNQSFNVVNVKILPLFIFPTIENHSQHDENTTDN
ncbi:MAG: hypothetical protein IJV56_04575, partial [Neisseriaceae bacterium]|nr:hypothetical protein [Neisseriaceae bacterium]